MHTTRHYVFLCCLRHPIISPLEVRWSEREKHRLCNPIGLSCISGTEVRVPWARWGLGSLTWQPHKESSLWQGRNTESAHWGVWNEPQITGQQDRNWESNSGCQKPGRSGEIPGARYKAGQGKGFTLNSASDIKASENRLLPCQPEARTGPGLRQILSLTQSGLHPHQWKWSFLPPTTTMKIR